MGIPCFLEDDRKLIEVKIYNWHKERGDPRAQGGPFLHPGLCCVAFWCGAFGQWVIHAQNYEVMKSFEAVQGEHLVVCSQPL